MHLRKFDALGARPLLERAIQMDPQFPLAHSALASTWSVLGYDNRARESAARAFELAADLPRVERLQVEGTFRELSSEWKEAIAIWQALSTFFPDDVEHTLRLANAQIASGAAEEWSDDDRGISGGRFPRVNGSASRSGRGVRGRDIVGLQADAGCRRRRRQGGGSAGRPIVARGAPSCARAVPRCVRGNRRRPPACSRKHATSTPTPAIARVLPVRSTILPARFPTARTPQRTVALYEEGLGIARAIGEQDLVARFLNNLAIQQRRAGNLQASLKMNQESLAIRREIGDRTNTAISLNNIGNVLLDLGDCRGRRSTTRSRRRMSREIGDRRGSCPRPAQCGRVLEIAGPTDTRARHERRSAENPSRH